MADKASENSKKGPFYYTTGDYWEGSSFPFWVHMMLTLLPTGFIGLDHLLLHSPQTALQKAIVNVFTLGFWYFYDIIQVFTDRSYVDTYGLSRPIVGPTGLGFKSFTGVVPPDQQSVPDLPPADSGRFSSLFLALYLLLIFVPFGIPNFIVGDTSGGVVKFIFTILFFGLLLPFVILSSVYELFVTLSKPADVYEKGVHMTLPFSWIINPERFAPNLMKPSAIAAAKSAESEPQGSILTRFIQPVLDMVGLTTITQALGAAKCAAEPILNQGQKTVEAATSAATGVANLAATVPEVATKVAGKLEAFTDPEKLKALTAMKGGGFLSSGELDSWFLLSIGVLLTSALLLSSVRWLRNLQTQKKNDQPPESIQRDDTPPQPNAL
jgi:hypothetical protein